MKDKSSSIKSFIKSRPVTIRKDIFKALNIPQRTLTWHLKKLVDSGEVTKIQDGYYFADEDSLTAWLESKKPGEETPGAIMNAREKILYHLETNYPTSAAEFQKLTKVPKSRITQLLRELTASGQLESYNAKGGIKRYRLTELHHKRIESILGWFESERSGTSSEVASDLGLDITTVSQILASLSKQGELYREWLGREKVWIYRKNAPFTFGCANQMTAFINKALREVRA